MSNGARLSAVIVVVAVAAIGLYFAFMTPTGPARTENPKAPVDALVSPDAAQGIGEMTGSAAADAGAANGAPPPEAFGAGSGTIAVPGTTDPAGSTIAAPGASAGALAGGAAGAAAATNANSPRTVTPVTTATPVTPTGSGAAGSSATTGTSSGGAVVPPVKIVTAPATPVAGTTQYTIKSGDTLEGIARAQMGDGQKWQLIAAANPGLDPKALKIGQKITIPASTTTASKDKAAGSSTAAPNTYTVQKGDTLIELSRKFYGNDAEWKRILEANATTLKGDAKAIAPGMKLVIPAKR